MIDALVYCKVALHTNCSNRPPGVSRPLLTCGTVLPAARATAATGRTCVSQLGCTASCCVVMRLSFAQAARLANAKMSEMS
jgi:hypothetical protein